MIEICYTDKFSDRAREVQRILSANGILGILSRQDGSQTPSMFLKDGSSRYVLTPEMYDPAYILDFSRPKSERIKFVRHFEEICLKLSGKTADGQAGGRPVRSLDFAGHWYCAKLNLEKISIEKVKKTAEESSEDLKYVFTKYCARKLYGQEVANIPRELKIPDGYRIIDSHIFSYLYFLKVDCIEIPGSVVEIREHAFDHVLVEKEIVIPDSVKKIGAGAFELLDQAVIRCLADSCAYQYAHEHFIPNSADISMGKCPYCGGEFEGTLIKKCSWCGRKKDYFSK